MECESLDVKISETEPQIERDGNLRTFSLSFRKVLHGKVWFLEEG